MSAPVYLQQILNREAVDTGIFSPVRTVRATLVPALYPSSFPDPHLITLARE